MARPTDWVDVQFAYGAAPDAVSPTWTSEKAYVRVYAGLTAKLGATQPSKDLTSGELRLVLSNLTRRFDPSYAAGPLFGDLVPGVPVRVRVTYNSVTETIFRGVVQRWPQEWAGKDSTVEVVAVGAFAHLATGEAPLSAWDVVIEGTTNKVAWWRVTGTSTKDLVDVVSSTRATVVGAVTAGESLVDGRPGVAGRMRPGEYAAHQIAGSFAPDMFSDPASLEFVYSASDFSDPDYSPWRLYAEVNPAGQHQMDVRIIPYDPSSTPGVVGVWLRDGAGLYVFEWFNSLRLDPREGQRTHLVITNDGSFTAAGWHLYVNGVDSGVPTYASSGSSIYYSSGATTSAWIGNSPVLASESTLESDNTNLDLSDVVIYDRVLTSTEVADHYTALSGRVGEIVPDRLEWVLDNSGWGLHSITSTVGRTCAVPYGQAQPLTLLQQLQNTEAGRIWEDRQGRIRYSERGWAWTETEATTVQATFNDTSGLPFLANRSSITPYSDRDMVNDVTVTRSGGQPQRATDPTSIATYGRHAASITDVLVGTDNETYALAEGLVWLGKDPKGRIDRIAFHPAMEPATLVPLAQTVEQGWRVAASRVPPGGGAALTIEAHVRGVTHTFTDQWLVELHLDGSRILPSGVTLMEWGTWEWDDTSVWSM